METVTFTDLKLSPELLQAVQAMSFEKASPIQAQAIPLIMQGHDLIGQAQTGTGKTVAFGIPLVEKIIAKEKSVQGIVLCPTRELAIQVAEEIKRLLRFKTGVNVLPIYGGQPIEHQLRALKTIRPQIIVGTPGRVYDHIERGSLKLEPVTTVILDEADVMLNMGFVDAIEEILEHVRDDAQTILFSATMPKAILQLTSKYLENPQHVKVAYQQMSLPQIEQFYIEVGRNQRKTDLLSRLLELHHQKLSLVFCNTKRFVDDVVEELQLLGYSANGLHGDLKQRERDRVMGSFRKGTTEILVATDIAARGIDVDNVEAVYNLDLPYDEEDYVHRIGRTGRAERSGKAFTFINPRELHHLKRIAQFTKSTITAIKPPSVSDVENVKTTQLIESIKKEISQGTLQQYEPFIERLIDETTSSMDVAAALLKMILDSSKKKSAEREPKVRAPSPPEQHERYSERRSNRSEPFSSSRRPPSRYQKRY